MNSLEDWRAGSLNPESVNSKLVAPPRTSATLEAAVNSFEYSRASSGSAARPGSAMAALRAEKSSGPWGSRTAPCGHAGRGRATENRPWVERLLVTGLCHVARAEGRRGQWAQHAGQAAHAHPRAAGMADKKRKHAAKVALSSVDERAACCEGRSQTKSSRDEAALPWHVASCPAGLHAARPPHRAAHLRQQLPQQLRGFGKLLG